MPSTSSQQITIIKPKLKSRIDFRELWRYRELITFFIWRDIKVRYKQSVLGISWAVLQPVMATLIFTLFFNRVAKIQSGSSNIPYPVFAYLGLLYWNFYSGTISTMSNSIIGAQGLINKIYFPRIIPPISTLGVALVDFVFASIVFFLLLIPYGIRPELFGILLFVPGLLLIALSSLGIGLFFSALNVKYRDVKSALPFLLQILLFITPIIYPVSLIPQRFQIFTYLNPAAGAITMVRNSLFGDDIYWRGTAVSVTSALILFLIGLFYFKKVEKGFVDIL